MGTKWHTAKFPQDIKKKFITVWLTEHWLWFCGFVIKLKPAAGGKKKKKKYVHVYKGDPSSIWGLTSSPAAHGSSGLPLAHTDTHRWMSLVQSSLVTNSSVSSCNPLVSVTPKQRPPSNLQAPYTWLLASYPIHQLIRLDLHYCLPRDDTLCTHLSLSSHWHMGFGPLFPSLRAVPETPSHWGDWGCPVCQCAPLLLRVRGDGPSVLQSNNPRIYYISGGRLFCRDAWSFPPHLTKSLSFCTTATVE